MFFNKGKSHEEIYNLQEEYVLTILNSKGVNIDEFKNSELYHAHETKFFIEKLYDLFHEFKHKCYSINDKQVIYLGKLYVRFENNVLEVAFNEIYNKYNVVDKNIYVNGNPITNKKMVTATIHVSEVSREDAAAARKQLQEDLNSCRIRTEDALDKSLEFAKTFKVK